MSQFSKDIAEAFARREANRAWFGNLKPTDYTAADANALAQMIIDANAAALRQTAEKMRDAK